MMKFEHPSNATLLNPDETIGMIPDLLNQSELNEWEAANILKAERWLFLTSHHSKDILTIDFIKLLHKKMFDETWKWAGQFRSSEKNIGVSPYKITTALHDLLEDVVHQILNNCFSPDEIAYRFHHRLVSIHPFANGNGRHSRLMTDLLLTYMGQPRFTWDEKNLGKEGPVRKQYIDSLREADKHNYAALALFVRS